CGLMPPASPQNLPGISGCHLATGVSTRPAPCNALFHAIQRFATARTFLAYFRAFRASMFVVPRADQHEMRRGATYLGARHHQLEVFRLDMPPARLKAVIHGHAKAGLVTTQTFLDA